MSEQKAPFSVASPSVRGDSIEDLPDADARKSIRHDLDATLFVEAAAGTGKTTELVCRIVAVIQRGAATLDRIVAVTFTEKAAGELKLRLRSGLERARQDALVTVEERARLDRALSQLEVARMGTIHSLCSDLLRERPLEARVDPVFEVMTEETSRALFAQGFDTWMQRALALGREGAPGIARTLRRKSRTRDRVSATSRLESAAWDLAQQRDFTAPWRRDPFAREAAMDALVEQLQELAVISRTANDPKDWLAVNLSKAQRFIEELERKELSRGARDYDGLEAEIEEISHWKEWRYKGYGRIFGGNYSMDAVRARRTATAEAIEKFMERANAELAALLHAELTPVIARYEALKAKTGRLDFLDLLLKTRALIRDDASVRADLQRRITHLFVDEFQDTDPLQAEILLLLAADDPTEDDWTKARPVPGKIFFVGDPKQSIYRFRRADVALYEATKRRLCDRGARTIYLTTSFRSAPSIQAAVNAAFEPVMQGNDEGSQATYVGLQPFREDPLAQPTIVALSVPRPYSDYGKITNWSVENSAPDAVGAYIEWLVRHSGYTVTERESPRDKQPIEARHICLLFKRFQSFREDVTRPFVRALEARRIPHVLVGGRSFHDREEVIAMRNVLSAIEWPEDELSVFATLRGPYLAFSDDALLAYRTFVGPLHPLHPFDETKLTDLTRPVFKTLRQLAQLHRRRNTRPIADSLGRFLDMVRAHAGIAIWPTGEQALANVLRVLDLARKFETSGATSFRAFVEWLTREADSGQAGEAPVVEEGTDGVRIMTVHRAKGLEFPVVVLADPTVPATFTQPSRHVDARRNLFVQPLAGCAPIELIEQRDEVLRRDAEESIRLAYVAATRARDMLVVPTCGDAPLEGWLDVLNPVLQPRQGRERFAEPAPNCPTFGPDSVLTRPEKASGHVSRAVAPGMHLPRAGKHRVVWWDPAALRLDVQPDGALRQTKILAADEEKTVSEAGIRAHAGWVAKRDEMLAKGALATIRVTTVTEQAEVERRIQMPRGVKLEHTEASRRKRPHGPRFGTLVHAVLASTPLDASAEVLMQLANAHARALGATAEEAEAAREAAIAALAHPLMKRAAAASEARREATLLHLLDDGRVVEGIVDLAFREVKGPKATWIVVDFKTDVELTETSRPRYEAQVSLYARAIEEATGERATGVLLSV
jgi:ATP-dependent exoDNAse (exonuclease V) beta subunit